MLGRVCLCLLAVVLVVQLAPVPQVEAAYFTTLRKWDYAGPLPQTQALKLAPSEDFRAYYFAVETRTSEAPASAGYLRVTHAPTGDLVCDGPLTESFGFHVFVDCPQLRVDHGYVVTFEVPHGADVYLYAAP